MMFTFIVTMFLFTICSGSNVFDIAYHDYSSNTPTFCINESIPESNSDRLITCLDSIPETNVYRLYYLSSGGIILHEIDGLFNNSLVKYIAKTKNTGSVQYLISDVILDPKWNLLGVINLDVEQYEAIILLTNDTFFRISGLDMSVGLEKICEIDYDGMIIPDARYNETVNVLSLLGLKNETYELLELDIVQCNLYVKTLQQGIQYFGFNRLAKDNASLWSSNNSLDVISSTTIQYLIFVDGVMFGSSSVDMFLYYIGLNNEHRFHRILGFNSSIIYSVSVRNLVSSNTIPGTKVVQEPIVYVFSDGLNINVSPDDIFNGGSSSFVFGINSASQIGGVLVIDISSISNLDDLNGSELLLFSQGQTGEWEKIYVEGYDTECSTVSAYQTYSGVIFDVNDKCNINISNVLELYKIILYFLS